MAKLEIETPSWGYADSGTRFGVFPQKDGPRDVFERVDDAAEVHRLTGTAPAVALHFPWDAVDDLKRLRSHIESSGLRAGAVNANLFQDPDYRLGSVTNPEPEGAGPRRSSTCSTACASPANSGPRLSRSGWPTAPTTPVRTTCASAGGACSRCWRPSMPPCPPSKSCWWSTSRSSRPSTPPTWPTGARPLLLCRSLGERARVLVDLGHHVHGVNVEQIVALLAMEGRLGGIHLNARRYADDDLIVGSVDPFGLFMVFVELTADGAPLPRLTIDQSHSIEPKVEAMVLSVLNVQEAYAKALLVDRDALRAAQAEGDILGAHRLLLDAFATDVRELCAGARVSLGAEADPLAAVRALDHARRRAR